ncbi:MAG: hypothetical protein Q9221_002135 [Calogaya cf. arnoldii]
MACLQITKGYFDNRATYLLEFSPLDPVSTSTTLTPSSSAALYHDDDDHSASVCLLKSSLCMLSCPFRNGDLSVRAVQSRTGPKLTFLETSTLQLRHRKSSTYTSHSI